VLAESDLQRQVREGASEIKWAGRRYRRREGWGNQALYPAQELRTIK
jgi:ribosomal protein L44E